MATGFEQKWSALCVHAAVLVIHVYEQRTRSSFCVVTIWDRIRGHQANFYRCAVILSMFFLLQTTFTCSAYFWFPFSSTHSSEPLPVGDVGNWKEGGAGGRKRGWMDHVWPQKSWVARGAFSPSGLSAAPGSNIHLAWCIPGLETLMWFVGESRWQVHGSTLLTDSAGASGRVHNNTECLSPPSFALLSKHTSYPHIPPNPTINTHTHTYTHTHTHRQTLLFFFFFFLWYLCVGTGRLHKEPFGMLTFSSALSVLRSLVFHSPLTVPSLSIASLSASTPSLRLCTHLCCLTSLRSLLLPQHSCTCPLTRPPPSFGSHSLHQSLSSFLFLHLSCSPLHPPRRARTVPKYWKIWCLVLPLRCRNDVMQ